MTVIGAYRGDPNSSVAAGFRRGARLRRNTGLKIFNSIFMDQATGLFMDGTAAHNNAIHDVLKYKNNLVALAERLQRVAEDNNSRSIFFNTANRNVIPGNLYYRLKQVDKDGRFSLSNTIVPARKQSEKLILSVLYPNPVSDNNLKLLISSSNQQNITVVVNDIFGRKMIERNVQLLSGNNNCQLNLQSIAAGNYFVTIIPADGGASQVQKFIKQ